jgi:molybdopterin converting factor small subunit
VQITFKLYASLTEFLPADRRTSNWMALEIEPESTIATIIAPFNLPMNLVHLVLINGVYVYPVDRATRTLVEGDVLAIWPPIAGG